MSKADETSLQIQRYSDLNAKGTSVVNNQNFIAVGHFQCIISKMLKHLAFSCNLYD